MTVVGLSGIAVGVKPEEFLGAAFHPAGHARDSLSGHHTDTGTGGCAPGAAYHKSGYTTDDTTYEGVARDIFDGTQGTVDDLTGSLDDATNDRAECANRVTAKKFADATYDAADY